jgi:hypothetical protein
MPSAQKAKQTLQQTDLYIQSILNSQNTSCLIEDLMTGSLYPTEEEMIFEMSKTKMFKDILSYIFFQYKIMCRAHKFEIMKYKSQLQGKGAFLLIECYLDKQNHLKSLLRKITQNMVIQEAFQEYVVEVGIFNKTQFKEAEYLSDQFLLNLLD